jgi:hypothetical protein
MTVSCIDGTFDCVYESTVNVPTLFVPTGSLIVRYVLGGHYDSESNLKFVSLIEWSNVPLAMVLRSLACLLALNWLGFRKMKCFGLRVSGRFERSGASTRRNRRVTPSKAQTDEFADEGE